MFEIMTINVFGQDVPVVNGSIAVVVTVEEILRDNLAARFDFYTENCFGSFQVAVSHDGQWIRTVEKCARSFSVHLGERLYAVRKPSA